MRASRATSRAKSLVKRLRHSRYGYYDVEHCNFRYLLEMEKIRKDRHQRHICMI